MKTNLVSFAIVSMLATANINEVAAATVNQLVFPQGLKVCSVYIPGNWRDTVHVPPSWTSATCNNYKIAVGAVTYQLGCIFSNSFKLGANDGGLPSPNCGW